MIKIIGFLLCALFIACMCLFVGRSIEINQEHLAYCIENGFDGVNGRVVHLNNLEFRCYKEVSHSSGVGVVTQYSGIIKH